MPRGAGSATENGANCVARAAPRRMMRWAGGNRRPRHPRLRSTAVAIPGILWLQKGATPSQVERLTFGWIEQAFGNATIQDVAGPSVRASAGMRLLYYSTLNVMEGGSVHIRLPGGGLMFVAGPSVISLWSP